MKANPFPDQARDAPAKLLLMVMKAGIKPGAVDALMAFARGDEQVREAGGELWFWHPDGIGQSKMSEKAQPRLIGTGTARNWNTVNKLAAMVGLQETD
jgi:uncharacterized protein (DUF1697 family)